MARVTIEVELEVPDGVRLLGCERQREGLVFEVDWDWPEWHHCRKCGHQEEARFEAKPNARVVRDLDIQGSPSFWVHRAIFHRCSRCGARQELIPPFRRERAIISKRFEEHIVRMAIGHSLEDVGRRLGVSAEMVAGVVLDWANETQAIDPEREITDIGLDELSLKKGHKLYVTILMDLTNPKDPRVLAVVKGKDEEAAIECLNRLTPQQREQVRTHRTDMGKAYPAACAKMLPNSKLVIDRFHVAKQLGERVDDLRKKRPESASVD